MHQPHLEFCRNNPRISASDASSLSVAWRGNHINGAAWVRALLLPTSHQATLSLANHWNSNGSPCHFR